MKKVLLELIKKRSIGVLKSELGYNVGDLVELLYVSEARRVAEVRAVCLAVSKKSLVFKLHKTSTVLQFQKSSPYLLRVKVINKKSVLTTKANLLNKLG